AAAVRRFVVQWRDRCRYKDAQKLLAIPWSSHQVELCRHRCRAGGAGPAMLAGSLRGQDWAMTLSLPIEPEATKLLHDNPLALLLGMVLDQQIPMEKAFSSPYVLQQRLGRDLDARAIVAHDPAEFEAIFARPPALHRFPRANAKRVQEVCQVLADRYDGDAAALWT